MSYERTITSRGHKYRQLVESRWDPSKKQSRTHVIQHLGKVIEEDGVRKVIPSSLRVDKFLKAYSVGELALFWNIIDDFGIRTALQNIIPDQATVNSILILVLNQLTGRRALKKVQEWVHDSPLPRWFSIDPKAVTKDGLEHALDTIITQQDEQIVNRAFEIQAQCVTQWQQKLGVKPTAAFFYQDVTRIKYNGDLCEWAEPGHGPERGKSYIGFGLMISRDYGLPLQAFPIRGSQTDSTTVTETCEILKATIPGTVYLVWDRGFVTTGNIRTVRNAGYHVLAPGVLTSNEVKEELVRYTDEELEQRQRFILLSTGRGVYYRDRVGEFYGQKCRIVVMLDPERRNRERLDRDALVQELELCKDKKRLTELKRELSAVLVSTHGRRGYLVDENAEQLARKRDGRTVFFCTDPSIRASEIIITYNRRDQIEKAFRMLRGFGCLSPIHYQKRTRVDAYLSVVGFVTYEIMAAIQRKLTDQGIKLSYKELLERLRKVHEIEVVSNHRHLYRWTHISKKEESLFKPFGIAGQKPRY